MNTNEIQKFLETVASTDREDTRSRIHKALDRAFADLRKAVDSAIDGSVSKPMAKRGRPKKVKAETTEPVKRGRPKKAKEEASAVEQGPKKRGRPKKVVEVEPEIEEDEDEDEDLDEDLDPEIEDEVEEEEAESEDEIDFEED